MIHVCITLESRRGGWGGWWVDNVQDSWFEWLLGNKSTLVKVRKRLCFRLNVPENKLNMLSVNILLVCSYQHICDLPRMLIIFPHYI